MKIYLFLVAIALYLAMAGGIRVKEILQTRNNNFTGRMFSKFVHDNPDTSLVLSAFSVLTPLAQLAMASEGTTRDELLNVIGFPNYKSILSVFSFINRKMKSIPGVELKMANRIYIPLYYELNDDFAVISENIFKSGVQKIDFADNIKTAEKINSWVEIETNHRIRNLIQPRDLSKSVRALLVNVLYFKGKWKRPFDERRTAEKHFYLNKKDYIKVPMMRNKETYKYVQSYRLGAQILEMPYVGAQSSMVIILPNEYDGIKSLVDKLEDLTILDDEMMSMNERKVDVSLPKFKIETKIDLKNLLQKMNVTKIFNAEANFNKLLRTREDDNMFVSRAVQKAFIEVNEEGAEASASNAVIVILGASLLPVFNADHPFMFLLRSKNVNLFSGIYYG